MGFGRRLVRRTADAARGTGLAALRGTVLALLIVLIARAAAAFGGLRGDLPARIALSWSGTVRGDLAAVPRQPEDAARWVTEYYKPARERDDTVRQKALSGYPTRCRTGAATAAGRGRGWRARRPWPGRGSSWRAGP
jgi:hypothetical protein